LKLRNIVAAISFAQRRAAGNGFRLHPQSDPRPRQARPIEPLAGVGFARRRNIGMSENTPGGNGIARQNIKAKRLDSAHLDIGIGGASKVVAAIGDLDTDGAAVDIARARPTAGTGMPGTALFAHHTDDGALLIDEIMRRDFRNGIAKPRQRRRRTFHAGIMQQENIDGTALGTRIEVWRWPAGAGKRHQGPVLTIRFWRNDTIKTPLSAISAPAIIRVVRTSPSRVTAKKTVKIGESSVSGAVCVTS